MCMCVCVCVCVKQQQAAKYGEGGKRASECVSSKSCSGSLLVSDDMFRTRCMLSSEHKTEKKKKTRLASKSDFCRTLGTVKWSSGLRSGRR